MKPVIRYRSQLLFRTSYRPNRLGRAGLIGKITFRPVRRFGLKPKIEIVSLLKSIATG